MDLPFSTGEIRDRYRRIAPVYDRSLVLLRLCGFRERHYRRRAVAALALRPGDTVVDLGCGTGRNLPLLRRAVGPQGRVIGVDLTDAMLQEAERRIAANGWTNVDLVEADAASYDFPPDLRGVLSTFAVTLAPTYDDVLRRAAAALAPGGRIAVMDLKLPDRWPRWLVRAAAWANRPYGVTLALGERHPWQSVRRYTDEVLFREFYFGALYLSVGAARPKHSALGDLPTQDGELPRGSTPSAPTATVTPFAKATSVPGPTGLQIAVLCPGAGPHGTHTSNRRTPIVMRGFGLGFVALTLVAGSVASQQHQHEAGDAATKARQMEMSGCSMMQEMMGMMETMNFLPYNVLRHKDALTLTSDQVSRIEKLSEAAMGSGGMAGMAMKGMPMKDMPMKQERDSRHDRMREAFDKTPADPAAIQAAMDAMAASHGRMMGQHLVAAAKVRDILTPTQRELLAKLPSPCMAGGMGMKLSGRPGEGPSAAEHQQHHQPPTG